MEHKLLPRRWLKITFAQPQVERLYPIAQADVQGLLWLKTDEKENLDKIWWSLGIGPDCQPMESVHVNIQEAWVCKELERSLAGIIAKVEEIEEYSL